MPSWLSLPPSNRDQNDPDPPIDHNQLTLVVAQIVAALGTTPEGGAASLSARLATIEAQLAAIYPTALQQQGDAVATGFSSMSRGFALAGGSNVVYTSGEIRYDYFTAPISQVCNTIRIEVTTARAGGTPTVSAFGLCTVAADGAPTLTASTVSDLTAFNATGLKDLSISANPFSAVQGTRYALASIIVTSDTTLPIIAGTRNAGVSDFVLRAPFWAARRTGRPGLESNTVANLLAPSARAYFELLP